MRSRQKIMIAICVMASATVQAGIVGSSCVTVTGVLNAESGGAVILALSPAIPGCTPNTVPGVEFGTFQIITVRVIGITKTVCMGNEVRLRLDRQ